MIDWKSIIPRWGGATIEPPEAKKDSGYIGGDKPPAKWENWLRKGTYDAVSENRLQIEKSNQQLNDKVNKSWGQIYTATLINGFTGELNYSKNNLGEVWLRGEIVVPATAVWNTTIASLVSGFLPYTNSSPGVISYATGALGLQILKVGRIVFRRPLSDIVDLDGDNDRRTVYISTTYISKEV